MLRGVATGVLAVAASLLCLPIDAGAQPSTRTYRIGWLASGNPSSGIDRGGQDFRQGLRDRGYVEGKNLVIEYRSAGANTERLPELAAELVRLQVDVIVTTGGPEALAAKRATRVIPVVMTEVGSDPVKAGLVASLGRPEANLTGLITLSEELWPKRLGLLREIVPRLARLAVLWNPENPSNASCLAEINAWAAAAGIKVLPLEVPERRALEQAFAAIVKDAPDAVASCWDNVTLEQARQIADFALRRHLATVAPLREYVEAGLLLSFGTSLAAHRRRAAYYIDKILKGVKPADLPVERPTLFEVVVNVTSAKVLGLTLPPALLVLADDLVQ